MADILEQIVEKTKADLAKRKKEITFRELQSLELYEKERGDFKKSLDKENTVSIIAEVKKASPSKGIIRADFNPLAIAEQYMEHGAAAISVLTDEPFFRGSLSYLNLISKISTVPLLRKDFIVDPYQIKEAKAYGADAVLLIATLYSGSQLSELLDVVKEFGLQALVECYSEEEFDSLDWNKIEIVGVNNRNLSTFMVDLHRGISILSKSPEHVIRVSESGLHHSDDLFYLWENGIHSALIGEHLMKQPNIGVGLHYLTTELEKLISDSLLNSKS